MKPQPIFDLIEQNNVVFILKNLIALQTMFLCLCSLQINSLFCERCSLLTEWRFCKLVLRLLVLPEKESLSGAKVSLSISSLIFLVPLEPSRRTVRTEYLKLTVDTIRIVWNTIYKIHTCIMYDMLTSEIFETPTRNFF